MIMVCCNSVVSLQPIDPQYADKLKSAIVEGIKCLVHGASSHPDGIERMKNYSDNILKFVELTCQKQFNQ